MIRVVAVNGDAQVHIETDARYSPDVVTDLCHRASMFYRDTFDDEASDVEVDEP